MDDKQLVTIYPQKGLDALKALVIDGLNSPHSKDAYGRAIDEFMAWYQATGASGLTKRTVNAYKAHLLEDTQYSPSTVNLRLSAIRTLAREAADNELISEPHANGIANVKGVKSRGTRLGNWLTLEQVQRLINAPDLTRLIGLRDRALLAVMIGGGLRRSEVANLKLEDLQQRDGRWVIVDLLGKGNRVRTVPLPNWAKRAIDEWTQAVNISSGYAFRPINKGGVINGDGITPQAVQNIVKEYADICGYTLSAHDLRRTFAQLARKANAPIDQIQLTLGHASVQTTERYLGTKQDLTSAPCDLINIKLD
jgi:integrase